MSTSRPARRARNSTRSWRSAKAKGRVALIYLESPANPTNALVDVEAVAAARAAAFERRGELPPIAIDNTFLGPLWAKPLAQGADISVYSLTKYAGGHSDLVAGGLVGKRALHRQGADDAQRRWAASATPTPPGCCCAASKRSSCA